MYFINKSIISGNINCFISQILWSLTFISLEFLWNEWDELSLMLMRFLVSCIFLLFIWISLEDFRKIFESNWLKGIYIGGIAWGIGGLLLIFGQRYSDPISTVLVLAMMPIAGMLIDTIYEKLKLTKNVVIGLILSLIGGYIATDVDYEEFKFKFGIIFCILSIFLFAWGTRETVILKEFSTIGRTTVTLYGGLIIVLICYFLSLILNPDFHRTGSFNISQLFILFIYTFPSAGLAQLFWIKGSEKLGVMFSTFHMNALPFYVMFFMIIFNLGDWSWRKFLGIIIVFTGITYSQLKRV